MKNIRKVCFMSALLVLSPALTSCDVHFGSRHFDVPWYVIAIPVAVIIIISIIVSAVTASHGKYRCHKCGKEFSPKWYQALFTIHNGSSRLFKCPECDRKGFCTKVE